MGICLFATCVQVPSGAGPGYQIPWHQSYKWVLGIQDSAINILTTEPSLQTPLPPAFSKQRRNFTLHSTNFNSSTGISIGTQYVLFTQKNTLAEKLFKDSFTQSFSSIIVYLMLLQQIKCQKKERQRQMKCILFLRLLQNVGERN